MPFRTILLGCILLFATIQSQAQQHLFPQLSNKAELSLITCAPGDQLYNAFGHSAIRLNDPILHLDFVYNYGTFNFDTPDFYMKFIQRKLLYALSKNNYRPFEYVYVLEKRGVAEQKLLLSPKQKQKLFEYLENNYQPENREYLYDFFYDNCATRIRDVLQKALGGEISIPNPKATRRFRSYLDEYLSHTPWMDFGIDLILGLEADRNCSFEQQMFLPDYLSSNLGQAQFEGKPLMSEAVWLLPKPEAATAPGGFFQPLLVTTSLFLVVAAFSFGLRNKKLLQNIIDVKIFLILGLAGVFLLFMWFGTEHIATQKNLNTLWANPLYLFWMPMMLLMKPSATVKYFTWLIVLCNVAALLMFIVPIQQFNWAVLPLILMIGIRLHYRLTLDINPKSE